MINFAAVVVVAVADQEPVLFSLSKYSATLHIKRFLFYFIHKKQIQNEDKNEL